MIIVSGCPRSGTSLMMDCIRLALGEDRIIGKKFPHEERLAKFKEKADGESEEEYAIRMYGYEKFKKHDDINSTKDMNPNGFWECRYTVQGVQWHFGIDISSNKVCKIVSQGLFNSDPKYVDKVIYMLRHPREVAKSQEKLKRQIPIPEEDMKNNNWAVHTPEMFIRVTYQAAKWLEANPTIPIIFVKFDELLSDPDAQLKRVGEFLGEGDFYNHPIEKKLYRSKIDDSIKHELWPEAEDIYEKMCVQDYAGVIDTFTKNIKKISKDTQMFYCFRRGRPTCHSECISCMNNQNVRENFKKSASVDWANEPCAFECGYDYNRDKYLTIEKSVKENFWNS